MTIPTGRYLGSILALAALQACAAPEGYGEAACHAEPDFRIATQGVGPEDLVAMPLNDGTSKQRIFAREVEGGLASAFGRCDSDDCRIGQVDVGSDSPEPSDRQTARAWRPEEKEDFHPLGMSLVEKAGGGSLYLIDDGEAAKLWKLSIEDGEVQDARTVFGDVDGGPLSVANDLQVVGDRLYVTRFDLWCRARRSILRQPSASVRACSTRWPEPMMICPMTGSRAHRFEAR